MKKKTKIMIGVGVGLGLVLLLRARASASTSSTGGTSIADKLASAQTATLSASGAPTRPGAIRLAGLGSLG